VRRDIDSSVAGLDSFTTRAFDMISSGGVRTALDLNRESQPTRDRYRGVEQFLTARRLIEAGVGCVTLSIGGWDTHGQNFQTLRRQLPQVDRGIANMIQDLHDRGLGEDVVTIMWGFMVSGHLDFSHTLFADPVNSRYFLCLAVYSIPAAAVMMYIRFPPLAGLRAALAVLALYLFYYACTRLGLIIIRDGWFFVVTTVTAIWMYLSVLLMNWLYAPVRK
jgi:hypothetical protein